MKVFVRVDTTDHPTYLYGFNYAIIPSGLRVNKPCQKECTDRTVMRPIGQALLGSRNIVKPMPHRQAFQMVNRSEERRAFGRSEWGSHHTGNLAAPTLWTAITYMCQIICQLETIMWLSEWWMQPGSGLRKAMSLFNTCNAKYCFKRSLKAHLITRRANRLITTARYSCPSRVQIYDMSAPHFWLGAVAEKSCAIMLRAIRIL